MSDSDEPSPKRRKTTSGENSNHQTQYDRLPHTLTSTISPPPPIRRNRQVVHPQPQPLVTTLVKSPFQLTWIRDLPESSNIDAVALKDILGDPMIAECWEFNYLHDLDYLMQQFDPDVKDLVKVHVIHGFWKHEDQSRLNLKDQAAKYPNITLHTAFMPEIYGTHHTKMLILIRHDSAAQVVIHTANMIEFDWTNMTQAVWRSPLLPLISPGHEPPESDKVGSGRRFKTDLLKYLKAYDGKRTICKPLLEELSKYDFSEIRAALVASIPGRHDVETESKTRFGWAGLENVLESVPVKSKSAEIVVQISSIATLGATDKWLDKTLFKALATSKNLESSKPKFRIVFPTPDEIRRSLNGYRSGKAIHTKVQSSVQAKQLLYLKPLFCHWAGDGEQHASVSSTSELDAGRKRAAPHIKTYVRFSDSSKSTIDWMLVTSANLSKQAWGEAPNAGGEIRVCSYEIGVMVWPELYGEDAIMVPTFKTDTPSEPLEGVEGGTVVAARMPYDLPLVPYAKDDVPWVATASYRKPDCLGLSYNVED